MSCIGSRHVDFEKIHTAFLNHYSKDPKLGESRYTDWVKLSGLDQTQSYYLQGAARATKSKQSFEWANFLLQFVKEDKDNYYYKVEALFPVESMNKDSPPFTRDEVLQAARSLTGKPSDLNHDHKKMLEGVEVVAAQFEDDCVECLVRIPKTSVLVGMIERKEIVNVSIEGEWSHGIPGHGLVLTGLGWLTKDTMLPGIPLTRIMPVEQIAENFMAKKVLKEYVNKESDVYCVFCSNPADYFVSICQPCVDKFSVPVSNFVGVERLEEKDLSFIAEKVAAKVSETDSATVERLKTEISEAMTNLSEAESNLITAEGVRDEAKSQLTAANKTIEDLRAQLPGGGLLKDPPKMMQVSEYLAELEDLRLPLFVERSGSGGMQQLCQKIRGKILKAQERLNSK
jgi:GTP-sensing pleiotropic transcriptional regulator CodY